MKIVKKVEEYKNDSRRMFKVVKDLQQRKEKKEISSGRKRWQNN